MQLIDEVSLASTRVLISNVWSIDLDFFRSAVRIHRPARVRVATVCSSLMRRSLRACVIALTHPRESFDISTIQKILAGTRLSIKRMIFMKVGTPRMGYPMIATSSSASILNVKCLRAENVQQSLSMTCPGFRCILRSLAKNLLNQLLNL